MRKVPTKALLDGDIILYRTAFWAEANNPDGFPRKLQSIIKKWTPKEADTVEIALSCDRRDNFRRDVWPNYKRNREALYVPEYLDEIKEYIQENYKCKLLPRIEADDILGIYASSYKSIAVTIDKDLLGTKGWHFNPDKAREINHISKKEAYRFFCQQWMTGDAVDGIPGLWRIGPKKATKFLDEWTYKEWEQNIIELYSTDKHKVKEDCGIPHPDIAISMARCVKILETSDYNLKTRTIQLWKPKSGL